ncbi:copper amine oxidase N-terminal domain-containing protein [uncultured Brevibacillus sp.]|uniref:copper amine oxidase N-terminal domain-containing protein n=1 Tax=uncultured Brevibacillus sp. TaxID=169970 RepID=UPI0025984B37|nr:copper amine oxidase N-terminal domain-containing protein [uncultured Brevibacillus sp.]
MARIQLQLFSSSQPLHACSPHIPQVFTLADRPIPPPAPEVNWNPADKSVTVTRSGVVVKLIIDNKIAYVNGKEKVLDTPATLVEGTTVVPSRFVSEALNAEVQWEPETGAVIIIDKEAAENTEASAATEASADAQ